MKSDGQRESQRHEKRLAKVIGGSRTAASGAFWSRKGDVRSETYLVEHKYTAAKSYSLKISELEKIRKEALLVGRIPMFCLSLGDRNYVLLLEDDFLELDDLRDTPSS